MQSFGSTGDNKTLLAENTQIFEDGLRDQVLL